MPRVEDFFSPKTDMRQRKVGSNRPVEWLPDTGLVSTQASGRSNNGVSEEHWLRFVLMVCLATLSFRLLQLQVVRADVYKQKAERNRVKLERISAPRGLILDRLGNPIVENTPNFSVLAIPSDLPPAGTERDEVIEKVASFLARPAAELEKIITANPDLPQEPRILAEMLPYDQALSMTIALQNLPGIKVEPRSARTYNDPQDFSAVVGYMSKVSPEDMRNSDYYSLIDNVGRTGLERQYEAALRGQAGQRRVERDSSGTGQRIIADQAAQPGSNLILGIDSGLQRALAGALTKAISDSHGTGGTAVAIDPRSGEVRALVSQPTFDPNKFVRGFAPGEYEALSQDRNHPFLNRAIAAEYPSGSTIKPVYAAAALDAGLITPQTTVASTGGLRVGQWFFPDWKAGGHGVTNVTKALAESVNTFFYMIGGGTDNFPGLGVARMMAAAARFGFGSPLGIDLPGELSGFLPSPEWKEKTKGEAWYIGDTYHLAIGQGDLLVTPLQIATATAAVANGGTVYQPHLVHALGTVNGEKIIAPVVINPQAAKDSSLAVVREGMRQGVLTGSSRALLSLPVEAAGKTGTAQIGGSDKTHAWFTSFAPYHDPQLVITVLVEKGGEGNVSALPVARAGYQYYFQQLTN